MGSTIRSQLITDAIEAALKTIPELADEPSGAHHLYRGEVPDQPPRMVDSDRVAPYAVLYPFPGIPGPGGDLASASDDLEYTCQVSCAAGFMEDCEALVDHVHAKLYLLVPTVAGVVLGWLKPPPGYSPGPIRVDRSIFPPRSSLPLQYRLVATAN